MLYPLVELSQQKYYFKSHIKEFMITIKTRTDDEDLRTHVNNLVRNI